MPMPLFQTRKDQLSRPVRSETLSSSSGWTWGLPVRIGSESGSPPASCDRILRLVPNPSRREGTNSAALRSRCYRSTPRARRRCQQVECTGCSRFSSATSQPVWDTDNTGADHFPPRVSAVPQLLWRIPRRSRPRDTTVAHWRLARVPHCLSAEEVDRLIAACSGTVGAIRIALRRCGAPPSHRHRLEQRHDAGNGERAIPSATATPAGCRRRFASLSECRPGNIDTDHVFIRSSAPRRSFASGDGVSSVVKHALKGCAFAAPHSGHGDVAEWRALGSGRPRPPSPQH